VKLKKLVQGIEGLQIKGNKETEITGLTADSNTVCPGNLFIAKKGATRDGAEFIPQAVQSGAAAVLTCVYDPFLKISQLICESPESVEAKLAAQLYGNPSEALWVAGVTGTKGKTTVSYLLRHLLERIGKPAGLIGTVETIVGPKSFPSTFTTHDAIRNQKLLREMASAGCEAAVLEVSSHGLEQGRVEEIAFDLALFTNLYPDHLDYHLTMEAYAAAKKKLFGKAKEAVFNADSPWTDFMRGNSLGFTYGIEQPADLAASEIRLNADGASFLASYQGKTERFSTPLLGKYNVSNVLAAISAGLLLGFELPLLAEIFHKIPTVPGRLERVETDLGFSVFVDFAHTGEALDNVLAALSETAPKRLIAVFGCGGGRDPGRRTGMAAAAEKRAGLTIITTDNSRNEDPQEICRQILSGFKRPEKARVELDRRRAIQMAIEEASPGDIVLIAGKGHERMQISGSQSVPFDDCLVAKEALQNRKRSAILL